MFLLAGTLLEKEVATGKCACIVSESFPKDRDGRGEGILEVN